MIDERALETIVEAARRVRLEFIVDGELMQPFELSEMGRIVTEAMSVDFDFRLAPRPKRESVRSRAVRMRKGKYKVMAASLEDVIRAKEHAGRQKGQGIVAGVESHAGGREAG